MLRLVWAGMLFKELPARTVKSGGIERAVENVNPSVSWQFQRPSHQSHFKWSRVSSDTLLHLAGVNANFRRRCTNERWCKRTFQQTTGEALRDRKYKKRGSDNSASLTKQGSRGGERWNISHICSSESVPKGFQTWILIRSVKSLDDSAPSLMVEDKASQQGDSCGRTHATSWKAPSIIFLPMWLNYFRDCADGQRADVRGSILTDDSLFRMDNTPRMKFAAWLFTGDQQIPDTAILHTHRLAYILWNSVKFSPNSLNLSISVAENTPKKHPKWTKYGSVAVSKT